MDCLTTLLILAVAGWVGLMFVMLIFYSIDRMRALNTTVRLAASMPLTRLEEPKNRHPRMDWYAGSHQNHRFVVHLHVTIGTSSGADGPRTSTRTWLRIVSEVKAQAGFGILRSTNRRRSTKSFETAFESPHPSQPHSASSQEALLEFLRKGYRRGYHDTNINFTRGSRNLVEDSLVPKTVLSDARALLLHDHPHPNRDRAQLEQLLEDLNEVARALEQEPAPGLEGQSLKG